MKVLNQPKYIPRQEYESQLERYVGTVRHIPGVISVMTMGSVKCPGLSDLDVICIVEDDFNALNVDLLHTFGKDYNRYIFFHGPVILPRSLFKDLLYIIYATDLTVVWGENLHSYESYLDSGTLKQLALMYLIDFTESRLLQYALSLSSKSIDKRQWLARIWSLTHSQHLMALAELDIWEEFQELLFRIRRIREEWLACNYESISDQAFIEIFYQSLRVNQRLFDEVLARESKEICWRDNKPKEVVFTRGNKSIKCADKFVLPYTTAHEVKFAGKKLNFYRCHAPLNYALHLQGYGFNPKGKTIQPKFINSDYEDTLIKRSLSISRHRQFLEDKGISFSMPGYLGLSRSSSKLRRYVDSFYWLVTRI